MLSRLIHYISLIIFVTSISIVTAQDLENSFKLANTAYADGEYLQAIEIYSGIINKGIESGEVYFNLANAYYKVNDLGRAILYYEKARKFLEGDPALEQNLKLAQLRIVDKIEPVPELFIVEWWSYLIHIFSLETWLWLNLIVFSILIIIIISQFLYSRRFLNNLIWTAALLFLLVFVITLSVIYEFETTKFGVILEEKVSVVSEPDSDGTEVFILHEGTKVKINRNLDKWMEISIPDGKIGWLQQTSIEII
jgi:tetratricopeptide (TPR) repeat protein